jgi:TetR/AcrR family transcriptional regulator, transcriptional repressor for nem operon
MKIPGRSETTAGSAASKSFSISRAAFRQVFDLLLIATHDRDFLARIEDGINGTGLSDLMAAAGLTHGGFYRHFDSKDQLVAESCAAAVDSVVVNFISALSQRAKRSGLEAVAASYLSKEHRDNSSDGCPFAALGSELARSDDRTRTAATEGFLKLVDIMTLQFTRTRPDVAKRRALVALSTMIGALTMSRIVIDPELSAAILRQTEKHLAEA